MFLSCGNLNENIWLQGGRDGNIDDDRLWVIEEFLKGRVNLGNTMTRGNVLGFSRVDIVNTDYL